MPRGKKASETTSGSGHRVATTPEARELQLIALATDLAEKQLRDGSASSQIVVHYLKLGSSKERIEKEIMEKQRDLIVAKTKSFKSADKLEKMYEDAMEAMSRYRGSE